MPANTIPIINMSEIIIPSTSWLFGNVWVQGYITRVTIKNPESARAYTPLRPRLVFGSHDRREY